MESAKYLGCTFTSDLRWSDHVNNICNKANRTIGYLKRNLNIGSTTVKQNAYTLLVRPLVEYASPVWDPYHQTEIDRIEMVQRRAARYVTNIHNNRSSVNQMLEHLDWKSLQQRRKDARLAMMYKITNEKVAIPKEGRLIPPKLLSRNMHDKSFQIPSATSDYRKYSFFPPTNYDQGLERPPSWGSNSAVSRDLQCLTDKAELNSYIFGGRGWGSHAHLSHGIIIS